MKNEDRQIMAAALAKQAIATMKALADTLIQAVVVLDNQNLNITNVAVNNM